jgi:hypothetical protein
MKPHYTSWDGNFLYRLYFTSCATEVAGGGHGWERRMRRGHIDVNMVNSVMDGQEKWKNLEGELRCLLDIWTLIMTLRMEDCFSMSTLCSL